MSDLRSLKNSVTEEINLPNSGTTPEEDAERLINFLSLIGS